MNPDDLPYRPCVGIMLIDARGLIFVGQRLDAAVPAWQMPQGGIDEGEKLRAAAWRELREETSISADKAEVLVKMDGWLTYDLPPDLLGKAWGGKYRGQRQKWFLMRYIGADDAIRLDTDHPEFARWKWIAADEMLAGIVPFKRDVYARVIDAFRSHLA